jgi:ABC-type uncharacterized transport system ATPase subunit
LPPAAWPLLPRRRVAEDGAVMVLATHKLVEICSAVDRATVLAGGRVVATSARPGTKIERLVGAMIRREVANLDAAMMSALGLQGGATPTLAKPPHACATRAAR